MTEVLDLSMTTQDPLHGKTLQTILEELVDYYGWEYLSEEVRINCFTNDPSISSSLKFLRRTPWARTKVEEVYRRFIEDQQGVP